MPKSHSVISAIRQESQDLSNTDKKEFRGSVILDRDFEDLDRILIGPGAWEEGRVAKLDPVVPPQGSLFLELSRPIKATLKGFAPLFRR